MATEISLFYGTVDNYDKMPDTLFSQGRLFFANDNVNQKSYLYFDDGNSRLNIVPRLLSVVNGGTGHISLNKDEVLIGNGNEPINFRQITNNISLFYIKANDNLITANTLAYWNGAYDESNNSNIAYVGNILKGTWNGSTIAVDKGGTGCTSFTLNGILYGNENNSLNITAAGTDGQIFTTIGGIPSYITPSLSWTGYSGGSNAPTINLMISKQVYSATIPCASDSSSGVVNTIDQTFSGNKTFTGAIISKNIYPAEKNSFNSGTENNFWSSVNAASYKVRDNSGKLVGEFYSQTSGDINVIGQTCLNIGNDIDELIEGNSQGILHIYSKNNTFAKIISDTSSSDKIITIPNHTGYMTISKAEDINPTLETIYKLPFFETDYQYLGVNEGNKLATSQGVVNSVGCSKLILGNNMKNSVAGNKYGAIQLYGRDDESFTLTPNITTVNEDVNIIDYTLYLPVPSNNTGELLFHDVNTSIGSTSRPVYITTNGKPAVISTLAVSYGGTGKNSLDSGCALIGNGTEPVTLRSITNNTSPTAVNKDSTNLITENTLYYHTGNSNITTVGTITSGAWQGSTIKVNYGGTGTTSAPNQGGIIYGASNNAYGCTIAGSPGQLLKSNGTAAPSWITDTFGSTVQPIYLKNGVPTVCDKNFDEYLPLSGGTVTGTVMFENPIKFNNESYGTNLPTDNNTMGQLFFLEDDGVLITTNYGDSDPTEKTKGWGIDGALYFKILMEE